MFVQQFFVKGIAHSSYLLGGAKTCAIIDPRRDIQIYIDAAKEMGLKITHILETHLHADFISGHLELAEKTGTSIYVPKSGRCSFKHTGVSEGDTFAIEDMKIAVLETPGHTPEHISYVVTDLSRGSDPVAVFCGDTLFVGDVGRPDLFPNIAQELAMKLYTSLHEKLLTLPAYCEVYPAHGAGSLCGRAMGAKRTSTIGYEKKYNAALKIKNKKKFIASLTTNMPPAPDHFSRCSAVNGKGPLLASKLPAPSALEPAQFSKKTRQKNTIILDLRPYDSFAGGHIPGAYHIDFGMNFSTFAGWVLPPAADIILVAETGEQAVDATTLLRRVGLDRVVGYLDGGMYEWAKAALPLDHVQLLSAKELYTKIKQGDAFTLVDVRAQREYQATHIKGALNIPVPDLRTRYRDINPRKPAAVICNTGHRSSLGTSILMQRGFKDVYNVAGGMTAYSAAGYAGECPVCINPHGPQTIRK
jgi:glyoxylase-like metal-dependent hydrolase (beta-lactamase superfamily II)/rhodanese-related sulfurtransferase